MLKCLLCSAYESIPDDGHHFSPFCISTGFDGFCWNHCQFVLEEDHCTSFDRSQPITGGDE